MEYIANEEVGESLPHFFYSIYIGINILRFCKFGLKIINEFGILYL